MSEKKKILIFIDWFLPGYKAGGPIRSVANMVDCLSDDFSFKIITTDTDYLETESYKNIESNTWTKFNNNTSIYYFSKGKLTKRNLNNLIKNTDFNIAYINGVYSFYFSILPLFLLRKTKKKIIVASRGMLSKHAFSSKSLKKTAFLNFAKMFGLYKNIIFQATDKKEADDIKQIIRKFKDIIVVPNLPKKTVYSENRIKEKEPGILNLVSIARISTEKNTLFALQILLSGNYKGNVQFDLYGSVYNDEYWQKCKKTIKNLPENIFVNYKGSVESSKVHETFSDYHFSFMPSKGENFGHSVLESLAAGCPVITSDQTPWRSLEDKKIGWDIALTDKNKFVNTIQKCIDMNEEEYNELSRNAFNFAKEYAENSKAIEQTKKLFE